MNYFTNNFLVSSLVFIRFFFYKMRRKINKRKAKKGKTVTLPRSESLESTKNSKMLIHINSEDDKDVNCENTCSDVKVTNNNLKIAGIEGITRIVNNSFDNRNKCENSTNNLRTHLDFDIEAPISERSQFSFENDTQSCLDYEPSDDELDEYAYSPPKKLHTLRSELYSCNNEVHQIENNEPFPENSSQYYFSTAEDSCRNSQGSCQQKSNQMENMEVDEIEENSWNDIDESEEVYYLQENQEERSDHEDMAIDESEGESQNKNVFQNVTVNFKDSLNLTITRSIFNNTESHTKTLTKQDNRGNANKAIVLHQVITRSRRWPVRKFNKNIIKITSADDIFVNNVNHCIKWDSLDGALGWCNKSETSSSSISRLLERVTEENESLASEPRSYSFLYEQMSEDHGLASEKDERENAPYSDGGKSTCSNPWGHKMPNYAYSINDAYLPQYCPSQKTTTNSSCSGEQRSSLGCDRSLHSESLKNRGELDGKEALSIFGSEAADDGSEFEENHKGDWLSGNCDINFMLNNLCDLESTSGCDNISCTKLHFGDVQRSMRGISGEKLNEVYQIVLKKSSLYTQFFDIFIECFKASKDMGRPLLVDMISDVFEVFKGTFIDKTSYILKIIKALEDTGITFQSALDYIILRYGTSQTSICDILLLIISEQPNLMEHWSFVRKIICCRREKLDHNVVINLLLPILNNYPPNKDMCQKIYEEIFKKNLVDVEQIPSGILVPLQTIANTMKGKEMLAVDNFEVDEERLHRIQTPAPIASETAAEKLRSLQLMMGNNSRTILPTSHNNNENFSMLYQPSKKTNVLNCDRTLEKNEINKNRQMIHNGYCVGNASKTIVLNNFRNNKNVGVKCNQRSAISAANGNLNTGIFNVPVGFPPQTRRHEQGPTNQLESSCMRRVYNNEVLRKVNRSIVSPPIRPQTPCNPIAHPTYQPAINVGYHCNRSLHNMYPEVPDCVTEISNTDLRRLREALEEDMNGSIFLDILSQYQNSPTIENFILNALTLIKCTTNHRKVFSRFMSLMSCIEKIDPEYNSKPHVKMTVEVLAINVVYFLGKKGAYSLCRDILLRVKDWHSLVTSKIFFLTSRFMSHMMRYIYIIKILINAKDFHWANELFQSDVLRLLLPAHRWPYQSTAADVNARNKALRMFFDEGFMTNIVATNDLLKHMVVVNGGKVDGFEVWGQLNDRVTNLIDSEETDMLSFLFCDITNQYARFMENSVLERFLLYMQGRVLESEALKLFKVCCDKGIYYRYTGKERVVLIRTTLSDFEIKSLLECYFENFANGIVYPHDFCIELILPESDAHDVNKVKRSIFSVFASVNRILKIKYNIVIHQSVESKILIKKDMLTAFS